MPSSAQSGFVIPEVFVQRHRPDPSIDRAGAVMLTSVCQRGVGAVGLRDVDLDELGDVIGARPLDAPSAARAWATSGSIPATVTPCCMRTGQQRLGALALGLPD